jgi:hypothetical protein
MSYTIIWSPRSIITFGGRISYLQRYWTEREIKNFTNRVKEYLETLKHEPFIGKTTGKRKQTYTGFIIKEVSLIYRVKPICKEIELLMFFDNRQNPKKLKKYKT